MRDRRVPSPRARRVAEQALAAGLAIAVTAALVARARGARATPTPPPAPARAALALAPEAAEETATGGPPATAPAERADAKLVREGRSPIPDGYLSLLPGFASADGTYDLVVHFHGNPSLVEESLAHAGIHGVFVPLNLGVGSAAYDDRFATKDAFPELLARVQTAMERRGLAHARLGRLALVAWSAGFAAVRRILERPDAAERVDAVVLLDGIHIGRVPGGRAPALDQLAPYERFARRAVQGDKLFTITHGDIAPDTYVGSRDTTDFLLARLGVLRYADGEEGRVPPIPAARGVLSSARREPLSPLTMADRGRFTVRGYAGEGPDSHVLHLLEMASIALPDLAAWWSRPRDASP